MRQIKANGHSLFRDDQHTSNVSVLLHALLVRSNVWWCVHVPLVCLSTNLVDDTSWSFGWIANQHERASSRVFRPSFAREETLGAEARKSWRLWPGVRNFRGPKARLEWHDLPQSSSCWKQGLDFLARKTSRLPVIGIFWLRQNQVWQIADHIHIGA